MEKTEIKTQVLEAGAITWLAPIIMSLGLLVIIGFLGWSMNRGMDISDEGFYLQAARHPAEVVLWPNAAHHITGLMFKSVGYNIFWFRNLGLILLLGSGLALGAGVVAGIRQILASPLSRQTVLLLLLMAAGGTLVHYILFLRTPSYNLLNAIAINLLSGLAIYLATTGQATRSTWGWVCIGGCMGTLIGLDFLVKFSSSIVMSIAVIAFLFLVSGARRRCWWAMIGMVGGTALCLGLFFALLQPMSAWFAMFSSGTQAVVLNESHQGIHENIMRYTEELRVFLIKCVLDVRWGIGTMAIVLGLTHRAVLRRPIPQWCLDILMSAVLLGVALQAFRFGAYRGGDYYYLEAMRFYADWMCFMAGMLVLTSVAMDSPRSFAQYWHSRWRVVAIMGFLFPLPLMAALGTNNSIIFGSLLCLAPWFCIMGITAWALGTSCHLPISAGLAAIIAVAAACGQVFTAGYYDPYRLREGIVAQKHPVNMGQPASIILVDQSTQDFWQQIKASSALAGFRSGDDMISFSASSGIDYALGGVSLGAPFFSRDHPGSKHYNELIVSKIGPKRLRRAFIVEAGKNRAYIPDLSRYGIQFPGQYSLCGQFYWPASDDIIRLWKPLNRGRD